MKKILTFLLVLVSVFSFAQRREGMLTITADIDPLDLLKGEGEFIGQGTWDLLNGSSIFSGVATVLGGTTGAGNLGNDRSNWSITMADAMLNDGSTSYRLNFEARTPNGDTGLFEAGRGFGAYFQQAVTGTWTAYQVDFNAQTESWSVDLTFGIRNSNGGSVEIRNAKLIIL